MSIFDSLYSVANDSNSLDSFLQERISDLSTFCSSTVDVQKSELDNFERFVLLKTQVIENLDFSKSFNRAFVYYLMDYCERFCSTSAIVQLYHIIEQNNLNIGSRLEAAMLYLYNVPSNQVFVDRFDEICTKIQTAINEEEDDDTKAIASFLNYYSYVAYNTHPQFAQQLQKKYLDAVASNAYPFLNKPIIGDCISINVLNSEELNQIIQIKIDELLGRSAFVQHIQNDNECLIERDTYYSELLANTPRRFQSIRQIAVQQFRLCENQDEVFNSLGRGVRILEEEAQLYSYLNSYGNMHEAKMLSALRALPLNELEGKDIEIFDWGCGQGLASVILQEFIGDSDVNVNIKNIVLIEPSEIALKRAALHVRHFNSQCTINTVLKDIDSITTNDLNCNGNIIKIHLFSNILDVDGFSMQHLISIVEQTQRGKNYFVCVSPYITDAKTARIDRFVQHFTNQHDTFHSYLEIENQRGEWNNNWTRVIRCFKVFL